MNGYAQKILNHAVRVVLSCETKGQFDTARNYCVLAARIMSKEPMLLKILSNTVNEKRWSLRIL